MNMLRFVLALLFVSSAAFAKDMFPQNPHLDTTPGVLCNTPDSIRYPEKIKYCSRNVDSSLKRDIIKEYDEKFGYSIRQMDRMRFKIDHLIPLCAGGANDRKNLWPQHESVYSITDPLEPLICTKMSEGRLKQADAVKLVIYAKTHLDEVNKIIQQVEAM